MGTKKSLVLIKMPIRIQVELPGRIWSSQERDRGRRHHLTGVFIVRGLVRSLKANALTEKRAQNKALNYSNPCSLGRGEVPYKRNRKRAASEGKENPGTCRVTERRWLEKKEGEGI